MTHQATEDELLREHAELYRALRGSLAPWAKDGWTTLDMPRVVDPHNPDVTYTPEGLDKAIKAAIAAKQAIDEQRTRSAEREHARESRAKHGNCMNYPGCGCKIQHGYDCIPF